ncbi:MAG: hypothetical protein FJ264_11810 [Planctomycetes bacterium]|nr:hypothetical protein [Planctomycetota bacterium]
MVDHLVRYRINTNWRYHVHQFVEHTRATAKDKGWNKRGPLSALEYCKGNADYAEALNHWLKFMKEEERFSLYVHFASVSLEDAKQSLLLLIDRQSNDPLIRMPLLRDAFTCYSRPFKYSYGRLGLKFRLEDDVGTPSPKEIHEKVIRDRDQLYAHCDLSAKAPRVSKFGIGLKIAGFDWNDYVTILPALKNVFDSALALVQSYIESEGMNDIATFFSRFEVVDGLSTKEPELLNQIYGYKLNKANSSDAKKPRG